jgi:transcriptional regulator with XRE-family HTH domain
MWVLFGREVRDARNARGWTVAQLAERAALSPSFVYLIEAGQSGSAEGAARLAQALGRYAELTLVDPRRARAAPGNLSVDPVHSLMGEFEAAHFHGLALAVGIDEPYQHFQFAGRADLVAWDVARRSMVHIENRTRFPDFQSMAGSFNGKRAYLARAFAERAGVRRWNSQTHVIAAIWSAEILHALRLSGASFRALCPDPADTFASWWLGEPPASGTYSTLIVLDPLASARQRAFVGLDEAMTVRPRHRAYAEIAARLASARDIPI